MTTTRILTIAIDDTCDIPEHQIADAIHRAIPGSHTLNNTPTRADVSDFEWDDGDDAPAMPMSAEDARVLADEDGYVTAVTLIDQDSYLEYAAYVTTAGADTHEDLVHRAVFDFGVPYDCTTKVVAVSGSFFVVSYTTKITEVL